MLSEFEVLRHKDGFFKCEKCPRRFLTKVGFENHSSNQHQKENGIKLDELPTEKYPNDILVCRLSSQSTTDLQSSAHKTPVFNKCIQCKQILSCAASSYSLSSISLKPWINHDPITHVCREQGPYNIEHVTVGISFLKRDPIRRSIKLYSTE